MAFTPVATTDTLETFRTRYNATPLTIVDDSSTTVDITLATDSLKLSGGTGIASAISGDTVTFNLSNTGVSAASYGSSTAIPVLAINAQGQITGASTASISTDLTVIDDASTSATISLATDSFKISGGTGTTSAISGDTLTINLDNTAVSAAEYGSATAIPVITVDAQGRITAASTASVSSDLTISDSSSSTEVFTLGSETLKFDGGTGLSAAISGGTVTYSFDGSTFIEYTYTATSSQTTFTGGDDSSTVLAYTAGKVEVYLNGVRLSPADYTATNGTSVVLGSGATAGDTLNIVASSVSNVSNISAAAITSGTLAVARGGTGISSYTAGDIITATGSTTLSKLSLGSAGQALIVNSGADGLEYGSAGIGTGKAIAMALVFG